MSLDPQIFKNHTRVHNHLSCLISIFFFNSQCVRASLCTFRLIPLPSPVKNRSSTHHKKFLSCGLTPRESFELKIYEFTTHPCCHLSVPWGYGTLFPSKRMNRISSSFFFQLILTTRCIMHGLIQQSHSRSLDGKGLKNKNGSFR